MGSLAVGFRVHPQDILDGGQVIFWIFNSHRSKIQSPKRCIEEQSGIPIDSITGR